MTELKPHQQRVVQEKAELDERLEKLTKFTQSRIFSEDLVTEEQMRMIEQEMLMRRLSGVLGDRIEYFRKEAANG